MCSEVPLHPQTIHEAKLSAMISRVQKSGEAYEFYNRYSDLSTTEKTPGRLSRLIQIDRKCYRHSLNSCVGLFTRSQRESRGRFLEAYSVSWQKSQVALRLDLGMNILHIDMVH